MLAGVSVDYYTRLERGNLTSASDSVLTALVQALHLDEAEAAHLFDLARAASASPDVRRRTKTKTSQRIRPSVQRILDAVTGAPALSRNGRMDYLAANQLGRALYAPVFDSPAQPTNTARFLFLDPASHDYFPHWDRAADDSVAILRAEAGHSPYDKALSDLIGELSTRSDEFRSRWAAHDVRFHCTGLKQLHHPVVGDLELTFEAFELPSDPGLTMLASPTEDALKLLASWAATTDTPAADSEQPANEQHGP